jgi:fatty aldehyde-generating acyl-ACP reductase
MKSAFLMHPPNINYIRRSWYKLARLWAGILPNNIVEMIIKQTTPYIHSKFKIGNHESMIVICPLTAKQMMCLPKNEVIKKLKKSCDVAYRNGAKIISLGAYSAIASNQGLDLIGKTKISLTTGRAYTIYSVMERVKPYLKKNSIVAIVGVDGAIGSTCAKLASKYKLIKIDKNNIQEVYKADIIISASNTIGSIINPKKLKKNAIVVDAAKPVDISRCASRDDLTIIDGGLIKIPGNANFKINFDCPPNVVYACMAEAFILGMANKSGNYCVGRNININMIKEIGKLGDKFGFQVL